MFNVSILSRIDMTVYKITTFNRKTTYNMRFGTAIVNKDIQEKRSQDESCGRPECTWPEDDKFHVRRAKGDLNDTSLWSHVM
jgi:hypothetical protein